MSPYNYCGGNPINRFDPDGRYIIVLGGSTADRKFFQSQMNKLFGGNVKVSFSEGGESRLTFSQTGKLNKSQQAAFNILSGYANDMNAGFSVNMSNNDRGVHFERYDIKTFDPSDFDQYPAGGKDTRNALSHYVHFFAEQYDRQVNQGITGFLPSGGVYQSSGENDPTFMQAHNYALDMESQVSGVRTIDLKTDEVRSSEGGYLLRYLFGNFKDGKLLNTYIQINGNKPFIHDYNTTDK